MLSNIIILLAFQFLLGALFGSGALLLYQRRQRKLKEKLRAHRMGQRIE